MYTLGTPNYLIMTTKFIGMKEFRQNMAKISAQARKKNQRLIVLRKNVPMFELRPLSKNDVQMEQFALSIQEGLEDVKAGRIYSHEQVKKMFGIV